MIHSSDAIERSGALLDDAGTAVEIPHPLLRDSSVGYIRPNLAHPCPARGVCVLARVDLAIALTFLNILSDAGPCIGGHDRLYGRFSHDRLLSRQINMRHPVCSLHLEIVASREHMVYGKP